MHYFVYLLTSHAWNTTCRCVHLPFCTLSVSYTHTPPSRPSMFAQMVDVYHYINTWRTRPAKHMHANTRTALDWLT